MDDALLRLVNHIYEGAVRPGEWPAIVAHMAAFFGTTRAAIFSTFVGPSRGGLGIIHGLPDAALRRWGDEYLASDDIWAQAAIRKNAFRAGLAFRGTDLVPESEFRQSRIYRELLQYVGIGHMCTGVIFDASGEVTPTTCGVYRPLDEPPFSEDACAQMSALLPHFSRSLGVMYRLRDAQFNLTLTLAALDRLATGVALFDEQGAIRHLNREAQRIMRLDDGLDRRILEDAARPALDVDPLHAPHFSAGQQVVRPSGKQPFVLQFAPLPPANDFSQGANPLGAIGFVTDSESHARLDVTLLQQLYGITAAESRLAERLCAGDTLAGAALRCGITEATAKTHLARLFERTHTARQAELLRLLMSLRAK
jgi:DNA-binding CsgD family transcriptional regulator